MRPASSGCVYWKVRFDEKFGLRVLNELSVAVRLLLKLNDTWPPCQGRRWLIDEPNDMRFVLVRAPPSSCDVDCCEALL